MSSIELKENQFRRSIVIEGLHFNRRVNKMIETVVKSTCRRMAKEIATVPSISFE